MRGERKIRFWNGMYAIEIWKDQKMAISVLAAGDEVSSQSNKKSKSEILFWQFDIHTEKSTNLMNNLLLSYRCFLYK